MGLSIEFQIIFKITRFVNESNTLSHVLFGFDFPSEIYIYIYIYNVIPYRRETIKLFKQIFIHRFLLQIGSVLRLFFKIIVFINESNKVLFNLDFII